jgi:hypothetical protein
MGRTVPLDAYVASKADPRKESLNSLCGGQQIYDALSPPYPISFFFGTVYEATTKDRGLPHFFADEI